MVYTILNTGQVLLVLIMCEPKQSSAVSRLLISGSQSCPKKYIPTYNWPDPRLVHYKAMYGEI